jgi:hypothetical protein
MGANKEKQGSGGGRLFADTKRLRHMRRYTVLQDRYKHCARICCILSSDGRSSCYSGCLLASLPGA